MKVNRVSMKSCLEDPLRIGFGGAELEAVLGLPVAPKGIVVLASGSAGHRESLRNRLIAKLFQRLSLGTLLLDLLTPEEDRCFEKRFEIRPLADRLEFVTDWLRSTPAGIHRPIGYFGTSTGASAALQACARLGRCVSAVVVQGGRPDLVEAALRELETPTLLIVGGRGAWATDLNREAFGRIRAEKQLVVIPDATPECEEPRALDEAMRVACNWFSRHLRSTLPRDRPTEGC